MLLRARVGFYQQTLPLNSADMMQCPRRLEFACVDAELPLLTEVHLGNQSQALHRSQQPLRCFQLCSESDKDIVVLHECVAPQP
jgi:hypothetical protein